MLIDTGMPRSVRGHAVSGAAFALMLSSAYEAIQYKQGQRDKALMAKNIIRSSIEGGIIAASGIAASNALGDQSKTALRSSLEALACLAAGVAGVYALNKIAHSECKLLKEKK